MQILRSNKWQATRYGLDGVFVNPVSASRKPIREAVADLLDFVHPEAEKLDTLHYLKRIEGILENGTAAHRQMEIYESNGGDFKGVIETMRGEFLY